MSKAYDLRNFAEEIVRYNLTPTGVSYCVKLEDDREDITIGRSKLAKYCREMMHDYEKDSPDIVAHDEKVKNHIRQREALYAARAPSNKRRLRKNDNDEEDMGPAAKRERTTSEEPTAVQRRYPRRATRRTMAIRRELEREINENEEPDSENKDDDIKNIEAQAGHLQENNVSEIEWMSQRSRRAQKTQRKYIITLLKERRNEITKTFVAEIEEMDKRIKELKARIDSAERHLK